MAGIPTEPFWIETCADDVPDVGLFGILHCTIVLVHREPACRTDQNHWLFDVVRSYLHRLEVVLVLDLAEAESCGFAEDGYLLTSIFDPAKTHIVRPDSWPFDIRADAESLFRRVLGRQTNNDPRRDCVHVQTPTGRTNVWQIDQAVIQSTNYREFGHHGLQIGDCWPYQLSLRRDGVHGNPMGSISGTEYAGVYSIIFSNLSYCGFENIDNLDEIHLVGTEGKGNGKESRATLQMFRTLDLDNPIRLFRKFNSQNRFAPAEGYRYDGLYTIQDVIELDGPRALFRFRLTRDGGQDPIRWRGPEKRPTDQQIKFWKKCEERFN